LSETHRGREPSRGQIGDRYTSRREGLRQVTLIEAEHLAAIASYLGRYRVEPTLRRRNVVTQGINLLALKHGQFRLGTAVLEYTGDCHPCSRMEENLGTGGYNAMRGHGGITARVLAAGEVRVGNRVVVLSSAGGRLLRLWIRTRAYPPPWFRGGCSVRRAVTSFDSGGFTVPLAS
jgi:hypothetical protein